MSDPLSPFEQELVNAMDEYAHHAAPPGFNPSRIIAGERRRIRVRISLATVSLATAAGIAACVATSAPGSGHAGLPVTGESTSPATASAKPSATPSQSGGPTSASGGATGNGSGGGGGTVNGGGGSGSGNGGAAGGGGGASAGAGAGSSAPAGGVVPSWPTAAISSPFAGSVPPVPELVSIRVGTHPEGGYDRISIEFSGQVPGYRVGYVQQVVRDGSGASVSMPGSAFLQLKFNEAQAYDANGNSTITPRPTNPVTVGYPELRSYVLNGDFEGYVSVALGLNAPNGFHVSELTKSATDHVICVDVAQK